MTYKDPFVLTYEEIVEFIAAIQAEIKSIYTRVDQQTAILDAFTHLVKADTQENNLEQALELGLTINGRKPTKKTSKVKLEQALEEYKKDALGITALNDRVFNELIPERHELEEKLQEATVTLPLSFEDMMLSGAMESELHMPLEVEKVEIQEVPQEDPAARAKRRIKESAILRQAMDMVKNLDNAQRAICLAYAKERNISTNLAILSDEDAKRWIDFMYSMLHMDALARETAVRERAMSLYIATYNKAETSQNVTTATKKATAKRVGNAVHVTSGDRVVSLVEKQTGIPVQPPIKEKKIAAVKPAKEVKKPVEKAAPDSLVTAEQEAACIIWPTGEYPGMSIPEGFRVRKERESGLYRVDHWTGTAWQTYINKAGKIGYTRFASELKQWFDKWQIQLGLAA